MRLGISPVRALTTVTAVSLGACVLAAGADAAVAVVRISGGLTGVGDYRKASTVTETAQVAAYAVAAVIVILWLFRTRANSTAITPQHAHRYGKPFVVLGWFVPVINLWVPREVFLDVTEATDPQDQTSGILVNTWWATCLAAAGFTAWGWWSPPADTGKIAIYDLGIDFLTIVAGILLIAVIIRIARVQEAIRDRLASYIPQI